MLSRKRMCWLLAFFCASGWVCNVSALEGETGDSGVAEPAFSGSADDDLSVTEYDTVSLNVQETDLLQVLQMLSIQGQRNIVPSPNVGGSVTANLYDVTFYEALDAILQQNAAGFMEKGNFIYIYTIDELAKIEESQQKVDHKMFRLHYITAADAQAFITPLMSGSPEALIAASGEVAAGFVPTEGDGGANSWAHYETLIVRDYPANLEEIEKVIAELDTPPAQVLVEATVLQAKLTDNLAFGVDISILADFGLDDILSLGSPLGIVDDMITGGSALAGTQAGDTPSGAVQSTVGNTLEGDAGVKVGILTNNVQVFVRALDSITDTTILANPKIMTLNRQRAEVLVGKKIAYLSTTTSATATTQTVEFLDTGTKLVVRPFVAPDGHIRMELKPSISSAELRDAGGGIVLPDETTQELTTNVMVMDGQTVVLGGLFTEQTTISRNQVPGLGNIPLLGNAFKGRDDSVTRDEVIFLITPHIVKDFAIAAAGEATMNAVDQRLVGAREGLLPWSRTKLTAAHMRDALSHIESGENEMAMWEVDMALGLDASMIEAQRLKEKLTGERAYWPNRSLLEESADLMIERLRGEAPKRVTPINPDPALNGLGTVGFVGAGGLVFEPIEEGVAAEGGEVEVEAVEEASADEAETAESAGDESSEESSEEAFTAVPAAYTDEPIAEEPAEAETFEAEAEASAESAEPTEASATSAETSVADPNMDWFETGAETAEATGSESAEAEAVDSEEAVVSSPIESYFKRLGSIEGESGADDQQAGVETERTEP